MDATKAKPLGASNIPKPSRLPTRTAVNRKRTIAQIEESSCDEGLPPSKRPARDITSNTTSSSTSTAKTSSLKSGIKPLSKALSTVSMRKPTTTRPGAAASTKPLSGSGGRMTSKKKPPNKVTSKTQQGGSEFVVDQIRNEMESLASRMSKLEADKSETQHTGLHQKEEIKSMEEQLSKARRQLSDSEHRLELAERSKASLQRAHDDVELCLTGARQEISSLKATVSQMVADAATVHCQLEAVKVTKDQALQESQCKSEKICALELKIEELTRNLLECQQQIRENESDRRIFHNIIQELKGNIRVFCRVRPLLSGEMSTSALDDSAETTSSSSGSQAAVKDKGSLHIEFPDKDRDSKKITIHFTPLKEDSGSKRSCRSQLYEFEYDHVFGSECCQENVFSEISQLVQSALDGYNVCIFAYGQTGSGKTYTMEGPSHPDEQTQGMIPRALAQVFAAAQELTDKGWTYKMEASFIEIYNETLRDLLATGRKDKIVKHEIRIDSKNHGEVYVTNITPVVISSEQQVTRLLETAAKNRAVAATECNERSSRSHCLFQLTLSGTNHHTMETCMGTLNLVDLAGSERLGTSNSAADRLKETQSINKSLSNLGNVIMALANGEKHIPYRNSKLTYLLQNSLGGNSKTLMFVNLSPQLSALQETLCSLRFASKVNQCNIGTARRTVK